MPSFSDFALHTTTLHTLTNMEITEPTPIQAEAIPALLAGHDLLGQSATGSGKTLAYSLPLVERLSGNKRVVQALVLVPTRELAVQVNAVISKLASSKRLATALLVGGRPYGKQNAALRYGAQIVVGTPGRVKDHIEQGTLVLNQTRICVLDEADQMLDIGFAPVIEEILTHTPETRQMALFSATMPDWIAKLEQKFLKDPVKVTITPAAGAQSTIEQIAYQVPQDQKMAALCTLLQSAAGESTLIFGRTKFGVEKLGQQLSKLGFMVGTLHGNKSQRAREDVLIAFRRGHVQTLLATNVAARGLDIQGIYQVINYELPESSELFTHRIGRTGRMGRQGKAITLLAPAEVSKWRRMSRTLGQAVKLERLVIDETAALTPQLPKVNVPERAQFDEPRPIRGRRDASPVRGRKPFDEQGFASESRTRWLDEEEEEEEGYSAPRLARGSVSSRPRFEAHDEPRSARGRSNFAPDFKRDAYSEPRPAPGRRSFSNEGNTEPYRELWPTRSRKPAPSAERERNNAPRPASRGPRPGRAADNRSARELARQSSLPEQFSSEDRPNKRGSKPASFSKAAGKRRLQPFITTEAQAEHQHAPAPVARIRKNVAARRSASR